MVQPYKSYQHYDRTLSLLLFHLKELKINLKCNSVINYRSLKHIPSTCPPFVSCEALKRLVSWFVKFVAQTSQNFLVSLQLCSYKITLQKHFQYWEAFHESVRRKLCMSFKNLILRDKVQKTIYTRSTSKHAWLMYSTQNLHKLTINKHNRSDEIVFTVRPQYMDKDTGWNIQTWCGGQQWIDLIIVLLGHVMY